jgi:hypothetical protein
MSLNAFTKEDLKSFQCKYQKHDERSSIEDYKDIVVLDMGSGTTKSRTIRVDPKTHGYISTQNQTTASIPHQKCLSESTPNGYIAEACIQEGIDQINKILEKFNADCNVIQCFGVATAWAREAKNAGDYFHALERKNVHILVISQDMEAYLGYLATQRYFQTIANNENFLVFDIGGGSFQLSVKQIIDDSISIYKGQFGSVNFAHEVRGFLELSNNYVTDNELLNSEQLELVREFARMQVTAKIREHNIFSYVQENNNLMYAIGDFMNKGILSLLQEGQMVLSNNEINKLLEIWTSSSEEQLHQAYPSIDPLYTIEMQTNLVLVESIMNGLGIDRLEFLPKVSFLNELSGLDVFSKNFEMAS